MHYDAGYYGYAWADAIAAVGHRVRAIARGYLDPDAGTACAAKSMNPATRAT